MDNLLHLGLSNAVTAGVLALLVAASCFFLHRRPALIHGLWLLVLLKLLTPPLVRLPAPWTADGPDVVLAPAAADGPTATDDDPSAVVVLPLPEGVDAEAVVVPHDFGAPQPEVEVVANAAAEERRPEIAALVPATPPVPTSWNWIGVAVAVWAAGSLAWFLLAAVRVLRFRRLLRFAVEAPAEVRQRAARLARKLGLARCPEVLLVPGRLSPMLFAAGGAPQLLVPAGLLGQVCDLQLDTLLLHELAHLRRRDHWVRGLEFLAMGLYWWNPVVWWARHELREAEEQCCDAWVVSVLSGSRRAYAEALVEALDFLSQAPPAAPLLASGIGHVSDLKRRLTMILSGTTPRALTWRGVLTVLGVGVLLPLLPAWVRAQPPAADPKPVINKLEDERGVIKLQDESGVIKLRLQPANEKEGEQGVIKLRLETADEKGAANVADPKVRAELRALEAQLAEKRAEIKMLEAMLQRLRARETVTKPADAAWHVVPVPGAGERVRIIKLADGDVAKAKVLWKADTVLGLTGAPQHGMLYELVHGEKGTLILRPVTPQAGQPLPAMPGQPVRVVIEGVDKRPGLVPAPPGYAPVPAPPAEKRTKDLEKRLDEIMRELEQLRKELKSPRAEYRFELKPETKPLPKKPDDAGKAVDELKRHQDELQRALEKLKKAKSESDDKAVDELKRHQDELQQALENLKKAAQEAERERKKSDEPRKP
jgi:beta-lactamase regulating signal transducer with metallopeptidase domain